MIRAILALVLIAAIVAAAVFFADNPGQVVITWRGRELTTSVGVLVLAVALLSVIVAALALLLAALRRLPRNWRRRREARRRRAADLALSRGLVALAAGHAGEARGQARRVEALVGDTPVGLLLAAEAAQREGDVVAARRAYAALLERPETEFLGLRGLIGQSLRHGDNDTARRLAARAQQLRPDARWLAETLLLLQARAGEWQAAGDTLTAAVRRGALPPAAARHHRGVVLYELARAAEQQGDMRRAAALAGKAHSLAPDLPGPACERARLQIALGRRRRATRTIERAWRNAPHPDLAGLYLQADRSSGPLARAAALQRLAAQNPGATESHVAIGEAALAASLWGEARRHLTIALSEAPPSGPSRRLCLLMARLEESHDGNPPAARDWLDRAIAAPPEPGYLCTSCAAESQGWQPLCPHCGEFDTLRWRPAGNDAPAFPGSGSRASYMPLIMPGSHAEPRPGPANGGPRDDAEPNGLAAAAQSDKKPPQAGAGIAPIAQR